MASLDRSLLEIAVWRIQYAFRGIFYPGDNELLSSDCHETEELKNFQRGSIAVAWNELPTDLIDGNVDCLPFFSPIAYRYFLPAYLTRGIETRDNLDSSVLQFAIYSLILPTNSVETRDHFLMQKGLLSNGQRLSITYALEAIWHSYEPFASEAKEALEGYWSVMSNT